MAVVAPDPTFVGRLRVGYDEDTDSFTFQGEVVYQKCGTLVRAPYVVTKSSVDAVTFNLSDAVIALIQYDDTDCV